MRREWIAVVKSADAIYFYNGIGGESGPWEFLPREDYHGKDAIRDLTRTYGTRYISNWLAAAIENALKGDLPCEVSYCSDDIERDDG